MGGIQTHASLFLALASWKTTSFSFPSLQLPPFVPSVICIGLRVPAGLWQACPDAELLKSQAREGESEAVGSRNPRATGKTRGLVYPGRSIHPIVPSHNCRQFLLFLEPP